MRGSLRTWLFAAVLLAPLVGSAADAPAPSWSYDLSAHLMSPYCPGRTLADCTSSQAAELRTWIADQEKAGVSRDQVESTLYEQFGDVILQAPKASGFGLAAYLVPALGLLAGGAFVVLFLRRQAARAPAAGPTVVLADPELERLIDEEMKRPG